MTIPSVFGYLLWKYNPRTGKRKSKAVQDYHDRVLHHLLNARSEDGRIPSHLITEFKRLYMGDACSAYHLVGHLDDKSVEMIETHPSHCFLVMLELILRCVYRDLYIHPTLRDESHAQRLIDVADALIAANVVSWDAFLPYGFDLSELVRDEVEIARQIIADDQQRKLGDASAAFPPMLCMPCMPFVFVPQLPYAQSRNACGKRPRGPDVPEDPEDEGTSASSSSCYGSSPHPKAARTAPQPPAGDELEEGEIPQDDDEESRT